MKLVKDIDNKAINNNKVSDKEAEEAFKTILTWIGEDPNREGLLETPKRVVKAFKEYFKGYKKISQYKAIVNIIWLQLLVKPMLLIFLKRE